MADELDDIIIDLTDLLEEGQPPQKAEDPAEPFDLAKELALSEEPKADDGVELDVELTSREEAALAEELMALDQPANNQVAAEDLSALGDAAVTEPVAPESAVAETQEDLLAEQPEAAATIASAAESDETPSDAEPIDTASQLIELLENPPVDARPAAENDSSEPPAKAASDLDIDELAALVNESSAQAAAEEPGFSGDIDTQLLDLQDKPISPSAEAQPSEALDEAASAAPTEADITANDPEAAAEGLSEPAFEADSTEPPAAAVATEPVEPLAETAPEPASAEANAALTNEPLTAAATILAETVAETVTEPAALPAAPTMPSAALPHEKDALLNELKAEVPGLLAEVVRPLIASLAAEIVREARRKLPEVIEQVIREEIAKLKQID